MVIVKGKNISFRSIKINRFDLASKKEETTNNAAPSTETNTVQTVPKSATNTQQQQQQQVAIPKHKRRDRIPERPNYRFVNKYFKYLVYLS